MATVNEQCLENAANSVIYCEPVGWNSKAPGIELRHQLCPCCGKRPTSFTLCLHCHSDHKRKKIKREKTRKCPQCARRRRVFEPLCKQICVNCYWDNREAGAAILGYDPLDEDIQKQGMAHHEFKGLLARVKDGLLF
jgi:hypothetical protein